MQLAPITAESRAVVTRFLGACTGWVRYKPLLVYLTRPKAFEQEMAHMQATLSEVLPKFAAYAGDSGFLAIEDEFMKYRKNVPKHAAQMHLAQATWKKLLGVIAEEKNVCRPPPLNSRAQEHTAPAANNSMETKQNPPLPRRVLFVLVEHGGFEPPTSTLRTLRATNCANAPSRLIMIQQGI